MTTVKSKQIQFSNTLIWPKSIAHAKNRAKSQTKSTWLSAMNELRKEVNMTGIHNVTVTANINVDPALNIHSYRSGEKGVSVIYTPPIGNMQKIAYCDKYRKYSDNLLAIVRTIRAYRDIRKWSVGFINLQPKGDG